MNTVEYNFNPGECVYVVLNGTDVREAAILQVDIRIYDLETDVDTIDTVVDITYIILLASNNDSFRVEPEQVFADVDDALNAVKTGFSAECVDLT